MNEVIMQDTVTSIDAAWEDVKGNVFVNVQTGKAFMLCIDENNDDVCLIDLATGNAEHVSCSPQELVGNDHRFTKGEFAPYYGNITMKV